MSEIKKASAGSAGLETQVPGAPATVSAAAIATGGSGAGQFIENFIDEKIFQLKGDDTPLMDLMLKAKKVRVNSPEVEHYAADEPRYYALLGEDLPATQQPKAVLPINERDKGVIQSYDTLLVKGVSGYDLTGRNHTPGKDLMLHVTEIDAATNCPIVRAVNGPRQSAQDEYCTLPLIPKNTKVVIMSNALYETQKEVAPDLFVPKPTTVYLQKRGLNHVVSDYFESQRKRIPFTKTMIAEQAIRNFKLKSNRSFWGSRMGKVKMDVPKMGMQFVYTTEGLRWQFKRELQHSGRWTVERIIALAKMYFTGADVPKTGTLLAGKNLLEQIQCIDFTKHPEINVTIKENKIGWKVTSLHTVFGDIEIKRDPTLDYLGWANSGALIDTNRLVHYIYSGEHGFADRIEGEEASRNGLLIWDALALKGGCHIWIDGEGEGSASDVFSFNIWESSEAPKNVSDGDIFYLTCDCPDISKEARTGQLWQATLITSPDLTQTLVWNEYSEGMNYY